MKEILQNASKFFLQRQNKMAGGEKRGAEFDTEGL
jgi:hypothetical protein